MCVCHACRYTVIFLESLGTSIKDGFIKRTNNTTQHLLYDHRTPFVHHKIHGAWTKDDHDNYYFNVSQEGEETVSLSARHIQNGGLKERLSFRSTGIKDMTSLTAMVDQLYNNGLGTF